MDNAPTGLQKLFPKAIVAKRRDRRRRRSSLAESASLSSTGSIGTDDAVSVPIPVPGFRLQSTSASQAQAQTRTAGSRSRSPAAEGVDSNTDDNTNNNNINTDSEYPDSQPLSTPVPYESTPDPESASASLRPTPISTHPSQIGHLTTSSPLVQAAHLPEVQTPESDLPDLSIRSSALPAASTDSLESAYSAKRADTAIASTNDTLPQRVPSASREQDILRSREGSTEQFPNITVSDTGASTNTSGIVTDTLSKATDRIRRLSQSQKLTPLVPPQTPPKSTTDSATPAIINTPPTPTDHSAPALSAKNSPVATAPPSPRRNPHALIGNMSSPRGRSRAGSGSIGPSKLSNITSAPLTPTPENPSNPTANFFSSMFSAVQNTANTLSSTISSANLAAPGNGKNRSVSSFTSHKGGSNNDVNNVEVESATEAFPGADMGSKEPAVKTIGNGDLSLSHLGIVDPPPTAPAPATIKVTEHEARGRSESAPIDANGNPELALPEDANIYRTRSLYEASPGGERTTPNGSVYEGKTGSGVQRSSSIRSAISRRRKRATSAVSGTSGNTVAAAIAAANGTAPPANAPKLTGFAVANKRRNRDFHTLFKSVPDDDYLIEDYSCALQRDILVHGRLYVSEGHLCFSSNIFGWVTTLVMSFDEIVAVEKRMTALVFKNGLEISTLHAKHIFASFTSRDSTYDLIVKIWKLGHPHLQSSLNGVRLEGTGGDRTEKIDETEVASAPEGGSDSGSADESGSAGEDDVYDEDEDNGDDQDGTQVSDAGAADASGEQAVSRKPSGMMGAASTENKDEIAQTTVADDFPGPATHAPTECGDAATHYDRVIGDDVVPAPLGKVYNLLFGAPSSAWMTKWLLNDQKCFEINMDDKKGLNNEQKTRTFNYIKPLNASIGPKQTKCMVTEQLDNLDFEKAVNVTVSTQNPDVPNGNIFVVKTKYCLSWAENNATRVQINCTIEWSGKSWLKGAIERGANEGQAQYAKDLFVALKAAVSSRPRSNTQTNGVAPKGKKRGRKNKVASVPTSDAESVKHTPAKKQDWGLLEPLRPFLGPIVDPLRPVLTGNILYGVLVGLLISTWLRLGMNNSRSGAVIVPGHGDLMGYTNYAQRVAAYEEMWRREESELWDWIEDRAGLDRLHGGGGVEERGGMGVRKPVNGRKKGEAEYRTAEEKLREEKMNEREVQEAIRVTEERLKVLKAVVERDSAKIDELK
ncbi:hypothetical protein NEUTE1DRAFT_80128 [Neurospora tetrasperma FGSC 2508]|uniref:VASt domain-containing protein n=1 Tax=Neurospora tetrasperma (strain FGSC 2508 / ATCC MYA-4615 / P0657) TaxID=510951 RepID=F8MI97_NEUT8|nr:uncharacterized protein NEUTE1DRAFT_80128 [Neurospora tetrasperma FGSC 2508]EGO59751.1 hypothetical protein NEUTE1DRAFT_80128 [Neurospora tetrasperma FGSC 2508]EGZ73894.1 hypothetical protein NEUTE2DRAFT_157269 [Neurospora tetrasperma FGSC 2509]